MNPAELDGFAGWFGLRTQVTRIPDRKRKCGRESARGEDKCKRREPLMNRSGHTLA